MTRLLFREAVAQTLGVLDFLCVRDKGRFRSECFQSRRARFVRLRQSHEVGENCRCRFRTTALVCATASRGCRSQRWLGDELEAVRNENVDGARSETRRTLMSDAFVDKSDQFRDSRTAVLYALAGDERGAGGRSSTLTCEAFDPFRARGPSEPRSRRRPCPRSRGPSPYRP